TGEQRQAALTRLFDYYLAGAAAAMDAWYPTEKHRRPRIEPAGTPTPEPADAAAARAWLAVEGPTLVTVCAHTAEHGWPRHTTALSATLSRYLDTGGYYPEALV